MDSSSSLKESLLGADHHRPESTGSHHSQGSIRSDLVSIARVASSSSQSLQRPASQQQPGSAGEILAGFNPTFELPVLSAPPTNVPRNFLELSANPLYRPYYESLKPLLLILRALGIWQV